MANNSRRSFIEQLTVLSTLFVTPTLWSWKSKKSKQQRMKDAILNVKPLGFVWETQDPFLFCVHHEDFFPKGNSQMGPDESLSGRHLGQDFVIKDGYRMYHGDVVPGFPAHPHKGFETITAVRDGYVDHADSLGAAGRYGNGDVQWMTAGKGVQHSEMFPLLHEDKTNRMELFQIWLNLPSSSKHVEPYFGMLWNDTIPKFTDNTAGSTYVEVIAGSLRNYSAPTPPPDSWATNKSNHVGVFNIKMEPNSTFRLEPVGKEVNRTIYFYEGNELTINGLNLKHYHSAEVDASIELELKTGNEQASILVLQGKPINEPVVQYGPFVMNTRQEIQQAFADFQQTQFGGWPWPKRDQVHDREKGRFAKHADGKVEHKD